MIFKKVGWIALLVLIQPVKVIVSLAIVAIALCREIPGEFMRDARSIWKDEANEQ